VISNHAFSQLEIVTTKLKTLSEYLAKNNDYTKAFCLVYHVFKTLATLHNIIENC